MDTSGCIFAPCTQCEKGYMLPFSRSTDVFELWRCSECLYTVHKR